MNTTVLVILAVINIPAYWLLILVIFGSWGSFVHQVREEWPSVLFFALPSDNGEGLRLIFWLLACVALVIGEYHGLSAHFPQFISRFA